MLFRGTKVQLLFLLRKIRRSQGTWLRAALCFAIGWSFTIFESESSFDSRFQLRSSQAVRPDIIVVHLDLYDWLQLSGRDIKELRTLRDISSLSDSLFWEPALWHQLLTVILDSSPKRVGISLFFPPGTMDTPINDDMQKTFSDPRVLWAARLDNDGRAILPALAASMGQNAGLIDWVVDDDRVVRRFSSPLVQVPHLAMRLTEDLTPKAPSTSAFENGSSRIINFAGPRNSFPTVGGRTLIENPSMAQILLRDKIVIIGTRQLESHVVQSPLGSLSRAEMIAQTTDNILENRWIEKVPNVITAIYLIVLLLGAIMVIQSYPQSVAVVILIWTAVASTATSLWVFDHFYLWIPILPVISMLGFTYILFLGHQLTLQENLSWRLEQQKKYLQEIEQLKNNFVSLFSHDLKTPIAKIQAICDRLLASEMTPDLKQGIQSLRHESSELHRYIQSILRMTRIESSDFQLQMEPTDINELIFTVTQQVRPLAEAKNIKINTHLEPIFAIDVDATLIQEVILNLVENAIKYSPAESHIEVSSQEIDDRVVVTVHDNGPGISPEEQPKIFEKFYRGSDHSLSTKGSGLGLFLVKYFVELHGGKTFIRSEPGQGARIGFSLPLEQTHLGETIHVHSNT